MSGPIEQFKIVQYFNFVFLPFTNSSLSMMVASWLVFQVLILYPKIFPEGVVLVETYFNFIEGLARQTIGNNYEPLIPFISSIFLFIFFGNLVGLIPGFFTFTSHIIPNIFLSSLVILVVLTVGFIRQGLSFFQIFCPPSVPLPLVPLLVPVELITFFMRIVTLSMRLCINMCVGHMIIKIFLMLAERFGIVGPMIGLIHVPFLGLEVCTSILQAYIFTILSCIYLKDAIVSHH